MRTFMRPIFAAVLLLTHVGSPTHALTLSDANFDDADWTTQVVPRGPDGTSDGSAMQMLTGGNPGAYRQVFAARDPDTAGLDNSTGVWSLFNTAYDPASMGGIATVDMSIDSIQFGGGSGGGLNAALLQDGTLYLSRFVGVSMPETDWTPRSFAGLTESSFRDPDDINSLPDFSSTGGAINFGWVYVVSSATGNPVSRTVGFDNWSVTVTPVPLPPALGLFGFGLASLVLAARRGRAVTATR